MAVFEGRWLPLSANWLTATMRETLSKSLTVRDFIDNRICRRPFVRADMDNGPKGSPHSRERGEPRLHRHARTERPCSLPQKRASNA